MSIPVRTSSLFSIEIYFFYKVIFPEGIDLDDSNDDNDLTANIEEEEGEANELSTKNNSECLF